MQEHIVETKCREVYGVPRLYTECLVKVVAASPQLFLLLLSLSQSGEELSLHPLPFLPPLLSSGPAQLSTQTSYHLLLLGLQSPVLGPALRHPPLSSGQLGPHLRQLLFESSVV